MTPNGPEYGQDQTEQAQCALREGIERARKLVREARFAMRQLDRPQPEPPRNM